MSELQEQPNPTGPEVESGDKAKIHDNLKKQRKGNIKGKIARVVASALALATPMESTMLIPSDTTPQERTLRNLPSIVRELSLQDLEERVETLYQIQIVSPEELPEIEIDKEKLKTLEWTRENMGRLMVDLDRLPPHFYFPAPSEYILRLGRPSPKPEDWPDQLWETLKQKEYEAALNYLKGRLGQEISISREQYETAKEQGYFSHILGSYPAEFILVDFIRSQENTRWIGKCVCLENNGGPNIQSKIPLDYRLFRGNNRMQEFRTVAHESIHRITKAEDQEFVVGLFGIGVFEQEKMREILGPSVDTVREQFGDYVGDSIEYGNKNTLEFLAEGGEIYLEGKDRFHEIYGVFIGEVKAEKFYDYMRDDIFKGTEYKDYQKITR